MTTKRRANNLDGRTWTRYSISLWDDLRKSKEELKLKHPALFPVELPKRLIECFLPPGGAGVPPAEASQLILDPFCGLGSTVLAAHELGHRGLGLDLNPDYVAQATARLGDCDPAAASCRPTRSPSSTTSPRKALTW